MYRQSSFLLLVLISSTSAQLLDSIINIFGESHDQAIHVVGKLNCNGQPLEKAKIKLYEDEVVLDVLLMEQYTNASGTVDVFGSKAEKGWIEPKVNIYHKCEYDGDCYRKISIAVPSEYIELGKVALTKVFDFGDMNVAAKYKGESVDCFN
ncbi:unnamed protein product [Auanema sp. JU1783]|nr:unnamed protein product [Auanema sp. JU1783]